MLLSSYFPFLFTLSKHPLGRKHISFAKLLIHDENGEGNGKKKTHAKL